MHGQDPDDTPTLGLADTLSADGILTYDSDVAAMGGNRVAIEFVVQAQDYSRKAAVNVSIQVGGYYLVVGASVVMVELAKGLRHGLAWFRSLPAGIKVLALIVVICAALHPRVRQAITSRMKAIGRTLPETILQVVGAAIYLAELVEENQVAPPIFPKRVA